MQRIATFTSQLDQTLRAVQGGADSLARTALAMPLRTMVWGSVALGALYGLCMGGYAVAMYGGDGLPQMLSAMVKVPLLFLLTLGITFPSLYVFSALAGSPLRVGQTARLLLLTIAVHLAVLASFGTIEVFFVLCTDSYGFIKLLNVLFFAVAGVLALQFLLRALTAVLPTEREPARRAPSEHSDDAGSPESPEDPEPAPRFRGPGDRSHNWARRVFVTWIVVYGVVGAQTGWILRPFIGSPGAPFELFRARESSFFADVLETLRGLFA